jgi:hypothetical protein
MTSETEFYDLVGRSPFTALCHVHDHLWHDTAFDIELREGVCGALRTIMMVIAVDASIARMRERKAKTK